MMALRDNWNTALIEFKESLNLIGWLPHEVVYEIQNALIHLLIMVRTQGFDNRRKEWKRAIAHLRRAHLDLLKICLFKIHEDLKRARDTPAGCRKWLLFRRAFSQARLKELQTLGIWGIYKCYRKIIQQFNPLPSRPSVHVPPAPPASTCKNYSLIEEYAILLWEWAQLETLQTSLLGQKSYDTSYKMVEAYLKSDDFKKDIKNFITVLKVNITIIAINSDCDNTLKRFPEITALMNKFIVNKDILNLKENISFQDIQQFYMEFSSQVEEIFPSVLNWLGISFVPLDPHIELQ